MGCGSFFGSSKTPRVSPVKEITENHSQDVAQHIQHPEKGSRGKNFYIFPLILKKALNSR